MLFLTESKDWLNDLVTNEAPPCDEKTKPQPVKR